MSTLLHSANWEQFQVALSTPTNRLDGQLFIGRSFGFGSYWTSSRCVLKKNFSIPEWTGSSRFLRLEPIDETSLNHLQEVADTKGLRIIQTHAIQPRQSLLVDISQDLEIVLGGYKPKHRYNVKVAKRHEVSVEIISHDLIKEFPRFWNLLSDTATRQEFRTHSEQYYRTMLECLEPEQMAHLVFAKDSEGDLATALLITHEGTATYLHGASSEHNKHKMAPFFLHTEAMRFAKEQGCSMYDFWGTDAERDESGEWRPKEGTASYGTTRFKLGFGGTVVEYPGCFDLILNPFWYSAYSALRALRARKRAFS